MLQDGLPKDDDPCDIHILDSKGSQAVEGTVVTAKKILKPLKIKNLFTNFWKLILMIGLCMDSLKIILKASE